MVANDPVLYDPSGREVRCSDIIAERGGWEHVSAAEANLLASFGCFPQSVTGFEGTEYQQPADSFDIPTDMPLWTGPTQATQETTDMNFGAALSPLDIQLLGGLPTETGLEVLPQNFLGFTEQLGQLGGKIVEGIAGGVGGAIAEQLMQTPQYQVGVTPGAACWGTGKLNRRMRVKLQRLPDGTVQVVRYCAPRRMNPLNPRALSRAARRLGSFHRIAQGIEKMVQKACKTGSRGRVRRSVSCAPKRCR